jgi:hypothetical protein
MNIRRVEKVKGVCGPMLDVLSSRGCKMWTSLEDYMARASEGEKLLLIDRDSQHASQYIKKQEAFRGSKNQNKRITASPGFEDT